MSAISLKSITGITSITTPAGVDNQLTLHNNNTTEAVKLDIAGNLHINNHLAVAGLSTFTGIVTATSFKLANGNDVGVGAGGTWGPYTPGIATNKSVGVNTNTLDDNDLVGVGNSFQGMYISNGMMITDNTLNGNHYIGTAFNGLMAGPVTIDGTLTIDGNYVVV